MSTDAPTAATTDTPTDFAPVDTDAPTDFAPVDTDAPVDDAPVDTDAPIDDAPVDTTPTAATTFTFKTPIVGTHVAYTDTTEVEITFVEPSADVSTYVGDVSANDFNELCAGRVGTLANSIVDTLVASNEHILTCINERIVDKELKWKTLQYTPPTVKDFADMMKATRFSTADMNMTVGNTIMFSFTFVDNSEDQTVTLSLKYSIIV